MPEKELRDELQKASLNQSGSRKQMIKRLRDHHREPLVEHRKKNHRHFLTENVYDYFIAIDFECTCEKGEYEYDHEIIEFPAVLVSVRSKKIIDTFRAVIRPKNNSNLTKYCTQLTGITQKMVDEANTFPEALDMFRCWMAKHGLDGLHNKGGNCRRFCYVTDGPWDIAKFMQADCIKWGMPIPHDFRAFLNLRRAFVNFYCHVRPGNPNPVRLPNADLGEMLKRLGMQFEGHEHCGMDDTFNIARIVTKMLKDRAELRVNEKLVNSARLLPWHRKQLIFTDEMWERQQQKQQNAATKPSLMTSTGPPSAASAEDIICAGMAKVGIWDDDDAKQNGTINGDKLETNGTKSKVIPEKHKWWEALPYKLVRVSREQFLSELFLECESCDDDGGEEEEAKTLHNNNNENGRD
ncbi:hypothetical protein GPALN_001800 [Globodera pallida]|nr:hypothetical protein GPALN_001800 [Globodera pallida]